MAPRNGREFCLFSLTKSFFFCSNPMNQLVSFLMIWKMVGSAKYQSCHHDHHLALTHLKKNPLVKALNDQAKQILASNDILSWVRPMYYSSSIQVRVSSFISRNFVSFFSFTWHLVKQDSSPHRYIISPQYRPSRAIRGHMYYCFSFFFPLQFFFF